MCRTEFPYISKGKPKRPNLVEDLFVVLHALLKGIYEHHEYPRKHCGLRDMDRVKTILQEFHLKDDWQ